MSDMAEEFSPRPAPAARQTRLFYDPASYSAFPHVIRMEGDELLVAFRQAPKVEGIRHTHPRSIITLIRSYDLGESWQVDAASQMGAGGGQELGLIYLGGGKVGGALAAHEVVHWHETERIAFPDPPRKEYPYVGGSPDTSIPPFAYSNVGALWCWSDNYGLTWRLEHAILVGDKAQACAPPVRTADGTLLIPAYASLGGTNLSSSVLYRSHDGGATWSEGTVMARGGADTRDYNEPAVIELEPGHLLGLPYDHGRGRLPHPVLAERVPRHRTDLEPARDDHRPLRRLSAPRQAARRPAAVDLRPPPAAVWDLRLDQRGRRPELGQDQLAGAQDSAGRPQRPRLHVVDPARRHAHLHHQLRPVARHHGHHRDVLGAAVIPSHG